MSELIGGCFCGRVRYELNQPPLRVRHCHCVMCQRAAGAPIIPWIMVEVDTLKFTGEEPTFFRSSAQAERSFCPDCGTALTYQYDGRMQEIDVALATLDDPGQLPIGVHVFANNAITWLEIDRHIPVREGMGEWLADDGLRVAESQTLEGSCLCEKIQYRVTGQPERAAVCHCGTCRKVSGGFATSWAIYPAEKFELVSGRPRAHLSSKTGERQFCGDCGSYLFFRSLKGDDIAEIMIATLDHPNLVSTDCHLFTDSAPAGMQIQDRLPRYPGSIADGGALTF